MTQEDVDEKEENSSSRLEDVYQPAHIGYAQPHVNRLSEMYTTSELRSYCKTVNLPVPNIEFKKNEQQQLCCQIFRVTFVIQSNAPSSTES